MPQPKPQPGIMDIQLYVGGASHVDGVADVLKLSSNENPWGPPAAAVDAIKATAADLHRYPSTDHAALRMAIGQVHGLDPDQIICGVGSDELITFLCQAYAGVGDEVIYTEHGFSMYKISASAAGATPVCVGETNRCVDVDKIIAGITDRTRLIFIANPANPTGTFIPMGGIRRLADAIPPDVILVLDGAYAEFAEGYDGGAGLAAERGNVVMTRTFSKLYGLGGLRVGWGYGSRAIIDVLNRVRGPFNLSVPALAAAQAAIADTGFAAHMLDQNAAARDQLRADLAKVGVLTDTSAANFVLARFASPAQAQACNDHLMAQGILVREVGGYGLPECLRMTVGRPQDCKRLTDAVAAFMEAQL